MNQILPLSQRQKLLIERVIEHKKRGYKVTKQKNFSVSMKRTLTPIIPVIPKKLTLKEKIVLFFHNLFNHKKANAVVVSPKEFITITIDMYGEITEIEE